DDQRTLCAVQEWAYRMVDMKQAPAHLKRGRGRDREVAAAICTPVEHLFNLALCFGDAPDCAAAKAAVAEAAKGFECDTEEQRRATQAGQNAVRPAQGGQPGLGQRLAATRLGTCSRKP
ncbi:MAG: hypothetical protein NTW87_14245, partial [Planctomycetota bacterium]|nr:hypothetical protein [Planctomycetota bacterium]